MKLMQEDELEALRNEIKEKNKENKRLNESFKTIKQTNYILKNQVFYSSILNKKKINNNRNNFNRI